MRISALLLCLIASACTLAPPPDQQSEAAQKAAKHTELNDAIQRPIDRAKSANDPNLQHDQDQEKAVEDSGG
jgi:hypothetical protein